MIHREAAVTPWCRAVPSVNIPLAPFGTRFGERGNEHSPLEVFLPEIRRPGKRALIDDECSLCRFYILRLMIVVRR